jgi:hypothetical protein
MLESFLEHRRRVSSGVSTKLENFRQRLIAEFQIGYTVFGHTVSFVGISSLQGVAGAVG